MKRLIQTRWIPAWVVLFFIFRSLFDCVLEYILINRELVPTYIDAMVNHYKTRPYNPEYVCMAKHIGYNMCHYYAVYIPIDTVFPLIYSCLFLSIASFTKRKWFRILTVIIVGGAAFDYAENISFSVFLGTAGDGLAGFIAVITLIKSVLFVVNAALAVVILSYVFIGKIVSYYRES